MTVLLPYLQVFGVQRITANFDLRNKASIGTLQKFGVLETGRGEKTREVNRVWYDSVYFALET